MISQHQHSSHQWQQQDKLQQINSSIKSFPGAANPVADILVSIHHGVSTTTAATICIHTMELQIISAEESKQQVGEWLVEET